MPRLPSWSVYDFRATEIFLPLPLGEDSGEGYFWIALSRDTDSSPLILSSIDEERKNAPECKIEIDVKHIPSQRDVSTISFSKFFDPGAVRPPRFRLSAL